MKLDPLGALGGLAFPMAIIGFHGDDRPIASLLQDLSDTVAGNPIGSGLVGPCRVCSECKQ